VLAARLSSAKCVLRGGTLNATRLTDCVCGLDWRCIQELQCVQKKNQNVIIISGSSTFCHILLSINIRFFVRTVPEWNSLPEACVNADTHRFTFRASARDATVK